MTAPEEPLLSVTLIARDEVDRLPGALASVAFADERVVVVDAASTDRTEEIVRNAGARVLVRPFDGFGRQKNAAAAAASNRWILSIDADEIVSQDLALEIRACLAAAASEASPPAAFCVPIRLEFLGRELRFGRAKILALGPIESLEGSVLHRSYRLRFGFLDGSAGFTFAALSSANTLLKYLKLRELERAIARGERTPPEGVRIEDTATLRTRALMRVR